MCLMGLEMIYVSYFNSLLPRRKNYKNGFAKACSGISSFILHKTLGCLGLGKLAATLRRES